MMLPRDQDYHLMKLQIEQAGKTRSQLERIGDDYEPLATKSVSGPTLITPNPRGIRRMERYGRSQARRHLQGSQ
jgi:hypothetical protein